MTERKTPDRLGMVDFSKCPGDLEAIIRREGGLRHAAKKLGMSDSVLGKMVHGRKVSQAMLDKVAEASLNTSAGPRVGGAALHGDEPKAQPQPVEPWDGSKRDVKYFGVGGKIKTAKKAPTPVADLVDRFQGRCADAARAAGWESGGAITQIFTGVSKYTHRAHERFVRALRGENPVAGDDGVAEDTYRLGLGIVTVARNDYERLEVLAQVMDSPMVFKIGIGEGRYLCIFSQKDRDKLGKFKKLGVRDAKMFVCP